MSKKQMEGEGKIKWSYNDRSTIITGETCAYITYEIKILDDGIKALAYIPSVSEDKNPITVFNAGGCFDPSYAISACERHLISFEQGEPRDTLVAKIRENEAKFKEVGDLLAYLRSKLHSKDTDNQQGRETMNTNKLHRVSIDLFGREVLVMVSDYTTLLGYLNPHVDREELNELKGNAPRKSVNGEAFMLNSGDAVIWIRDGFSTEATAGILIHEASHVAIQMLNDIGILLCEGSEEIYAYMTGYISTEAIRKLGLTITTDEQKQ
jgi:hypothetical protein|nr:MAG TPA: hypothetical protein [Caudoviricetes sp.]